MGDGTILYTGGFELPDKNAAALRVLGNAKALRALGYHVVLLGVSKDDNGSQGLVASGGQVEGFDTWHIRYPDNIRQWVSYLQSIDGLKAVCRDCGDVQTVICYNYPSMGLMKAKSFCHVNRIRLIADTTEWYPMADVKWSHKLIKGVDTWWRMRILQKRLDGLIVINHVQDQPGPAPHHLFASACRRAAHGRAAGCCLFRFIHSHRAHPGHCSPKLAAPDIPDDERPAFGYV